MMAGFMAGLPGLVWVEVLGVISRSSRPLVHGSAPENICKADGSLSHGLSEPSGLVMASLHLQLPCPGRNTDLLDEIESGCSPAPNFC